MKRAAAGVACLTAALSGAYAAPATRKGEPRTQAAHAAQATLGDALTASIQDAIRGAVTKVKAHHEVHPEISLPPDHFASAALSLGRKTATKVESHAFAQSSSSSSSLRGSRAHGSRAGEDNPWEPAKPLRFIDHDLSPEAPLDDVAQGVEAQTGALLPPGYWPRVVYYPDHQEIVDSFPQSYHSPVPHAPENFLICKTSPSQWLDKKGIGCEYYATAQWCTREGKEGPKWKKSWGALSAFGREDVSALQACCQCGGGSRIKVVGSPGTKDLADRHLLASPDRLPDPQARWFERNNFHLGVPERPLRPNQAPEDYVPLPIKQMAPKDSVDQIYARYFNELHDQNQKLVPRGFSVRYYNVEPKDCVGVKPVASSIDLALAYGEEASLLAVNSSSSRPTYSLDPEPVYMESHMLEWPTKEMPAGGMWWAKWSGTVMVIEGGRYNFNLDIGFNTKSELKIDGKKVITDGQCRVSQDKGTCKAKGCAWDEKKGACKAEGEEHVASVTPTTCKAGTYRSSPMLFGCEASTIQADVTIQPAGVTTVMTVPAGVTDFSVTVQSAVSMDLQMEDKGNKKWVVKFSEGIVNNQQRDGTYHGMAVSFSGSSPAHEFIKLNGATTSPLEVSIMSYSGNPATVRLITSHGGQEKCKKGGPPKGCEKLKPEAQKNVEKWSANLQERFSTCPLAWKAVTEAYPGGQLSWSQWEPVWSMAWGQESAFGAAGGAVAWQMGFAIVDTGHDGFVSATEFLKACALSKAAKPKAQKLKPPPVGKNQDVSLDKCITVKVLDKASWPKSVKGGPDVSKVVGSPQRVVAETKDSVKILLADGKKQMSLPKGTYYCVYATGGKLPKIEKAEMVSTRGKPEEIFNVEPIIIPGDEQYTPLHLLQEDLPKKAIKNSMDLGPGAHCIEAMVMVTPGARHLKLKYAGPDTHKREMGIPGQLVHCDPSIPACTQPLRDTCSLFHPQCKAAGPSPGPSPAPAA